MGSAARVFDFQNVLSWASSGMIRSSCMSLRTKSIIFPLGLPLRLFPGTIMSTIARTSSFSSSLISLTFSCMLFTPSSFLMSTLFTLSLNSSQHPHLCFLENLFLLLSSLPTFCSTQKYWSNDSYVEGDLLFPWHFLVTDNSGYISTLTPR